MQINLIYDRMAGVNIGYPNLAQHKAAPFTHAWRQFDHHWPWVVPLRLLLYFQQCQIKYLCTDSQDAVGWYPVAFGWFDFDIDYFDLIPVQTRDRIRKGQIRVLFYYHEGDNPDRIQARLHALVAKHALPDQCFAFVSANTASTWYFSDHECFFRYVNNDQQVNALEVLDKQKDFTLLCRQHKWWRISAVADLWRDGVLDNSLWSYPSDQMSVDTVEDNPISVHTVPGLPEAMHRLLQQGPYRCDDFDRGQQNDHHSVNSSLYTHSWFHIVMETHYDADQSGGTFLTEKTWKCIKYRQPFVLIGPAGSLQHLRDMGFKVFDHVLDNSYDRIQDPTARWLATKTLIQWIQQQNMQELWNRCRADAEWNGRFFDYHADQVVNTLAERLRCL